MDYSLKYFLLGIVAILIIFFLSRLCRNLFFACVSKMFYNGKYSATIFWSKPYYKFLSKFCTRQKGFTQTFDFFATILAVSHFALKDYEKFLFYVDTIKKDADEKNFLLAIYFITVSKDVPRAEECYAAITKTSPRFSVAAIPLLNALLLFKQGKKEEAYPLLKDVQPKLKMLVLKEMVNEYLSTYPAETT